jgi:hypothetical protein
MAVWRRARVDFTFKGQSYRAGEVFAVAPILAVQLRNRVEKAKAPTVAAPVQVPAQPSPRRRARSVGPMTTASVVAQPVETPVEVPTAPGDEPEQDIDLSLGTYARKDLRADD